MNNTAVIIACLCALIVGVGLILLYKKKIVDEGLIHGVSEIMDGIIVEDQSVFGLILEYSRTAVKTVEQLVKTGKIEPDDTSRKDAAMRIVAEAARVDQIEFGPTEQDVASACIEAEVHNLPHGDEPF